MTTGGWSVYGKDAKSLAVLDIDNDGGRVLVNGKGEGAVAIGINEHGNGAVSTWDKTAIDSKKTVLVGWVKRRL